MSEELVLKALVIIFSGGVAWGISKWRMDRFEKDFDKLEKEVWGQIESLRNKNHDMRNDFNGHIRDSDRARLDIEKDFGQVRLSIADTNGAFKAIMESLEAIKVDISELKKGK